MLDESYRRISTDYHRQNPAIIVGFPGSVKGVPVTYQGFGSQDNLNIFADSRIRQLLNSKRDLKRRAALMFELSKASFFERDTSAKASFFYSDAVDAIFFDVFLATHFLLGEGKITRGAFRELGSLINYDSDLVSSLGHELAHYDLGLALPKLEIRNHAQEQRRVVQYWQKTNEAYAKGQEEFRQWQQGEGRKFFERLEKYHGSSTPTTVKKEIQRLGDLISQIEQRIGLLNIRLGEEALAYNFGLGREQFIVRIQGDGRADIQDVLLALFEKLKGKIKSQGKLSTLEEMEAGINTAWTEGRELTSILL